MLHVFIEYANCFVYINFSKSQTKRLFPVKLTEPLTAILYITSDRQHIEELQHAIHVKEVVEGMFILNQKFNGY